MAANTFKIEFQTKRARQWLKVCLWLISWGIPITPRVAMAVALKLIRVKYR